MSALRLLLAFGLVAPAGVAEEIRLNQVQVIGSHNSYHVAASPAVMELIARGGADRARAIDYTHPRLSVQFSEQGVRQIELDIFTDPDGGRFADPAARKLLRALGKDPGVDPNANGELSRPGLKVLHVPDLDYGSSVPTFAAALGEVRAWSDAHPRHVPILVLVELKESPMAPPASRPVPFDQAGLKAVEGEILAAFPRSHLLTPDDVRGEFATLPEAIGAQGWPSLESVRGKVLFALDNEGRLRDLYLDGHPALRGRLMFATAPGPEHPSAAWFKVNDPIRDFDRIQDLVRRGFLVRTRADADTAEARANDGSRRDKALSSGAQFVSTDFPAPRTDFSPYRVRLPGDVVARKNPVSGRAVDVDAVADLEGEAKGKR